VGVSIKMKKRVLDLNNEVNKNNYFVITGFLFILLLSLNVLAVGQLGNSPTQIRNDSLKIWGEFNSTTAPLVTANGTLVGTQKPNVNAYKMARQDVGYNTTNIASLFGNNYTIFFRINVTAAGGIEGMDIFSQTDHSKDHSLIYRNPWKTRIQTTSNQYDDSIGVNFTAGQEYDFAMKWENGNITAFVNGTRTASNAHPGTLSLGVNGFSLNGGAKACDNTCFAHTIRDFAVWNQILTDAEIYNLSYFNSSAIVISNSISLASVSPSNFTYTSSATPTFSFNITAITGTWNTSLIINGTSYGSNNSLTTTGIKSITSTALVAGNEYLWWINATDTTNAGNTQITEKRLLYITGASVVSNSTSCVQNLGLAYFRPNNCQGN